MALYGWVSKPRNLDVNLGFYYVKKDIFREKSSFYYFEDNFCLNCGDNDGDFNDPE